MDKGKEVILDTLLSGLWGVLFDDPEMLYYATKKMASRYLESQKEAGKKITAKTYLAGIGALRANSLMLDEKLKELEQKIKQERAQKKGGKNN